MLTVIIVMIKYIIIINTWIDMVNADNNNNNIVLILTIDLIF